MKRKVNLVGQSTLTVSLPSKWAEKVNLKKGDEIELLEEGKNLRMLTGPSRKEAALTLTVKDNQIFPNRAIFGPYLRGYTEVNYLYENPKNYYKLLSSVKKMVGFDILEQSKNRVKLAAITSGDDANFLKLMNRLCFILKTYADTVRSFLESPTDDYTAFSDFELECDKISLYCRRLINAGENLLNSNSDTAFYAILSLTEQIGDDLDDVIDYFRKGIFKKYKYTPSLNILFDLLSKSTEEIFSKIHTYVERKSVDADTKTDFELKSLREDFKETYFEILKKDTANAVIAVHLFSSINKIKHMSEELF